MKRGILSLCMPLLFVGWLIGCGGGSNGSNPSATNSPTPTPTPPGTRAVKVTSVSPTTLLASGGQTVTIWGEGFSGRSGIEVRQITLNNIVVVSDTEITGTFVSTSFTGNSIERDVYVLADGISSFDPVARVKVTIVK